MQVGWLLRYLRWSLWSPITWGYMVFWVILCLCRVKLKLPKMPWLLLFPVRMDLGIPSALVTCVGNKLSLYWKSHIKNAYDRTGRLWFKFLHVWRILWPDHVLHSLWCFWCCSAIKRSSLLVFKSPWLSKISIVKISLITFSGALILIIDRSGDYMATLAKVHCACRGWPVDEPLKAIV